MVRTHTESTVSEIEPLSNTVVYAVAACNDVDPLDLTERLYDCIDPDALDRLFAGPGASGTVRFRMAGCHVVVEASGTVRVTRLHGDATTAEAEV